VIKLLKIYILNTVQLIKKIIFLILKISEDNYYERPYNSEIVSKRFRKEYLFKIANVVHEQLEKTSIDCNNKEICNLVSEFFQLIKNKDSIKISHDSICFNRALYLFIFIRLIKPNKIFESGINFGFSTYIIDKANNYGAKHYAFDTDFSNLKYKKNTITYINQDIETYFEKNFINTKNSLAFFDDHISHSKRLKFCKDNNINDIIFDDDLTLTSLFNDFSAPAPTASIIFGNKNKKNIILRKFNKIKKVNLDTSETNIKGFKYFPLKDLRNCTGFITFSPMSLVKQIKNKQKSKRKIIIYNASSDDTVNFWIEKFGLDSICKSEEFEKIYINTQACFFKKNYKSKLNQLSFDQVKYFSNLNKLESYLNSIEKNSIVWILNYGHDYSLKILKILNNLQIKSLFHQYLLFHQSVPITKVRKNIIDYLKIVNFFKFLIQRKLTFKKANPHAVMYSGTLGKFLASFMFPKAKLISTLSPIIYTKKNFIKKEIKKKYFVYVAQNIFVKTVDKQMFETPSRIKKISQRRNEFYNKLNLLFSLIEKKYNIEVIIALKRKSEENYFRKRKKFYKCSDFLIKNSSGVIGHYSTQLLANHFYYKKTLLIQSDLFNEKQTAESNNFSNSFFNNHILNLEQLIENYEKYKKFEFYKNKSYSNKIIKTYISDDKNNLMLNESIINKLNNYF